MQALPFLAILTPVSYTHLDVYKRQIMEQTVAMEVPRIWLEGISEEPLTLQEIFRVGLYHYKVERALRLYREGVGSLGFLAEQLGLPKRELIREARQRGIEPDFSPESIREDLA